MADYNALKVPELKKLLVERSLPVSGNKGDLVARLTENDSKSTTAPAPTATAEDEIDWDDDEPKTAEEPSTESAAVVVAAGGQGPIDTPVAVPNQKADIDPSATSDLKVSEPAETSVSTTDAAPAEPEAPKVDFSIGLKKSDAEIEAEKRAARAKRFNLTDDKSSEDAKKLERAKKFGTEAAAVAKGLDDALPERRPKRGREDGDVGRDAKKQNPDRKQPNEKQTSAKPIQNGKATTSKKLGSIMDDPVEKAKAEARAKKFGQAV